MNHESEVWWLDEQRVVSLEELAQLSGLSSTELLELVHCGALTVREERGATCYFAAQTISVARTAGRLRDELELDVSGLGVALRLLERVRGLEAEIARLRALLPHD